MGAKDSKPSCITYEEAVKRVSDNELRRIKEAFKRLAGTNGTILSKNAFKQDVLSEGVPIVLGDWLYSACGGTSKGISFKELFCGLVLLTRGTQDEKIRFLWNLYCNDSDNYLSRPEFSNALQVETSNQSSVLWTYRYDHDRRLNHSQIIHSLFSQSDRITFEQFRAWIIHNRDATVLSNWLLVELCVSLTSELETPTFYQSLAGVTHLEEQDIGDLEKTFWQLKGIALTGQLDLESIGPLLSPPIPYAALAGVFQAFDENRDGHIDFKELCCGVSAACRGPNVERSKFCFKIFDADRDGKLNFEQIKEMLNILLYVANESSAANSFKNVTFEQVLADLYHKACQNNNENKEIPVAKSTTVEPFQFTQEDFMMWSVESSLNLVQPFLDLLFEVCHIVLGLRPQCKHIEYDIVKGWLSREVRRGYKVGQFWYLISMDWWQNWTQYTQNSSSTPCTHCKVSTGFINHRNIPGIDEAVICDESFTSNSTESMGDLLGGTADSSSLGSSSSGISFGKHLLHPPGPIENTKLIAPNMYKNVQTLTGEGGRLRTDLLIEQRDFQLVPESLWKALSQWYRGPLPLPRQVIQPQGSPTVELELYPLNLRILRHQNTPPLSQTVSTWGGVSGYGAVTATGTYATVNTAPPSLLPPKKYLAYTAAFSRLASIKQVADFLSQRLKIKLEDVRLWHIIVTSGPNQCDVPILLEEEHLTLTDLRIEDNDQILLEIRNKDLTWPEELGSLTLSQAVTNNQERRPTLASTHSMHAPGATGLHNLGNTCFMNAALQVLFNTQPLNEYFLKSMHLYELNSTNKLGTKGQLALRYGELLKEIWTASTRSVAPLKLRFCVTKYAPRFAGGGQHDSQELLEWLLDGLHEDLNRVTEKPYSELKDSDGRADTIVATEAWTQHHSRNQSIVIDLFYGQLKSKVSCLSCGRDSVRFDPFSLLSLPLPVENYVYCEALVVLLDGSVPVKYGVRLNSECNYLDMKVKLSSLCHLDPDVMLICEISNSQIKCILTNEVRLKTTNATELYVYELPTNEANSLLSNDLGSTIEKGLKDIQRNADQHQLTTTSFASTATQSSSEENNVGSTTRLASGDDKGQPRTSKDDLGTSPENNFTLCHHHNSIPSRKLSHPSRYTANSENGEISSDCDGVSVQPPPSTNCYQPKAAPCNSYLIAVHRKNNRQDTYFLSYQKSKPSLFGVPLLIPCYANGTNKDLYCSVWIQVARLLSPLPPTPPDQANHATDCDDSLGYEFPFTLRAVKQGGRICAICPWSSFCRGCEIPCNEYHLFHGCVPCRDTTIDRDKSPLDENDDIDYQHLLFSGSNKNNLPGGGNDVHIAIDWDPTALHLRYQSTRERIWTEDESVRICRKQQTEPVDLNHCLTAFTSEEKLEQSYSCSHCKERKQATKKLQIWKLPPILIIHLKRFNFVNNKWVKSQKVVNFPFEGFDPTPYLASVPQETILRHNEIKNLSEERKMCNRECEEEIIEFDKEHFIPEIDCNDGESPDCSKPLEDQTNEEKPAPSRRTSHPNHATKLTQKKSQRQRLISTSLAKTPVVDDELVDYHDHNLKEGEDAFDLKYRLYAVVSHSGALNGGHYISYASNPNGSWYCYNDSSCREIPGRPNIDPGSAYLLFYERRGLDYKPYLPNVDGRPMPNGHLADPDDENDFKKMCVIS